MRRSRGTGSVWTKPKLNNWYFSFYRDGVQHQVNTGLAKTEENREEAEKMLAAEVAKRELGIKSDMDLNRVKYEDLRAALVTAFLRDRKTSLYTDGEGKHQLMGAKYLDKYFAGVTVKRMFDKLPHYPAWVQKQPEIIKAWEDRTARETAFAVQVKKISESQAREDACRIADAARDASINRSLSTLRSMYSEYSRQHPKAIAAADIPYMPRIKNADNVGRDFVTHEMYQKILAELPKHLRPIVEFMYYTGMRSGAAKNITWGMVRFEKKAAVGLDIPSGFLKNRDPYFVPLTGPLKSIADTLKHGFRTADLPVFDSTNLRRAWNKACAKLGLGVLDSKTQQYHGLHPHDLRRSAASNMIRAGVPQVVAMKITGHKSPAMFRRYNIVDPSDMTDALSRTAEYLGKAVSK
jgi:integrase